MQTICSAEDELSVIEIRENYIGPLCCREATSFWEKSNIIIMFTFYRENLFVVNVPLCNKGFLVGGFHTRSKTIEDMIMVFLSKWISIHNSNALQYETSSYLIGNLFRKCFEFHQIIHSSERYIALIGVLHELREREFVEIDCI